MPKTPAEREAIQRQALRYAYRMGLRSSEQPDEPAEGSVELPTDNLEVLRALLVTGLLKTPEQEKAVRRRLAEKAAADRPVSTAPAPILPPTGDAA